MCCDAVFGAGKIKGLGLLLERYAPGRVFLVTGKDSYSRSGVKSHLDRVLSGKQVLRHAEFSSDPKIDELFKGVERFHAFSPDMIIAAGGGTVIDTAKLLSVLPADERSSENMIKGTVPLPDRELPFIAVPTTAGSGSEATGFAVAYAGLVKYSVCGDQLRPDHVILDPELTYSLPPQLTAVTAFDAFSQAVEAYWAVGSTVESRRYAAESIKLVTAVYSRLISAPDQRTRALMMKAAYLSGKAIDISGTTAPHACSYILTARYRIPHGYAVVLSLPAFFRYNGNAPENKISEELLYTDHEKRISELCMLLGASSPEQAARTISSMILEAGFGVDLSGLGIKRDEDLEEVIDNVNSERARNNPVKVTRSDLMKLLRSIL